MKAGISRRSSETRRRLRGAIIGMVLGDGTLSKRGALTIGHSTRQREYLLFKAAIAQNLQRRAVKVRERTYTSTYGTFPAIRFTTQERPIYRRLRKLMYPNGAKSISRRVLDYLDERGIAIWFMDDGSTSVKNRRGRPHAVETTLNTYCSQSGNQIIIGYFLEKWGLRFGLNKSHGGWRLRMGTREARRLATLISPFVIPSMQYKLEPLHTTGTSRKG